MYRGDTGLAGYPRFEYALPESDDSSFKSYQLYIETPSGGTTWDMFIYWPEGDYSPYFYGGTLNSSEAGHISTNEKTTSAENPAAYALFSRTALTLFLSYGGLCMIKCD